MDDYPYNVTVVKRTDKDVKMQFGLCLLDEEGLIDTTQIYNVGDSLDCRTVVTTAFKAKIVANGGREDTKFHLHYSIGCIDSIPDRYVRGWRSFRRGEQTIGVE